MRNPRWLTFAALLLSAQSLHAQGMDVPASVQIPLLYKILTFDRNFASREQDELVIGILYQEGFRSSVVARQEVEDAMRGAGTVGTRKVRAVAIEQGSTPDLAAALREGGITVLYLTPLRGVSLTPILRAARSVRVMTFTGVPPYVERGVAVGIGLQQERALILVNLTAAKAEGSDYNAQLLRVAKVVEGDK
jgi:hypothetical protein